MNSKISSTDLLDLSWPCLIDPEEPKRIRIGFGSQSLFVEVEDLNTSLQITSYCPRIAKGKPWWVEMSEEMFAQILRQIFDMSCEQDTLIPMLELRKVGKKMLKFSVGGLEDYGDVLTVREFGSLELESPPLLPIAKLSQEDWQQLVRCSLATIKKEDSCILPLPVFNSGDTISLTTVAKAVFVSGGSQSLCFKTRYQNLVDCDRGHSILIPAMAILATSQYGEGSVEISYDSVTERYILSDAEGGRFKIAVRSDLNSDYDLGRHIARVEMLQSQLLNQGPVSPPKSVKFKRYVELDGHQQFALARTLWFDLLGFYKNPDDVELTLFSTFRSTGYIRFKENASSSIWYAKLATLRSEFADLEQYHPCILDFWDIKRTLSEFGSWMSFKSDRFELLINEICKIDSKEFQKYLSTIQHCPGALPNEIKDYDLSELYGFGIVLEIQEGDYDWEMYQESGGLEIDPDIYNFRGFYETYEFEDTCRLICLFFELLDSGHYYA